MKKVLVIEDDEPLCWLLEKILGNKYEVSIMNDGMEALSWLSSGNTADLIISDIRMPSLDGLQLLENLKQSGLYRDIPVIILSSFEDPRKRKECLDLGAVDYFIKPFEPQHLVSRVKEIFVNSMMSKK
ncbi:MAG TPA: response regulator [Cyclobacteriaceae bacterium]|nr:response regulator [Cyclobacteriaceae bacterium]HRJ83487.1 response regulator [Cyclobacteriaceae bacterium]